MKYVIMSAALCCGTMAVAEDVPWAEKTFALGQAQDAKGVLSKDALDDLTDIGKELFVASFLPEDGAGRPMSTQAIVPTKPNQPLRQDFARASGPDASSCAACHNLPVVGGAGDFVTNVFAADGFVNHDFETIDGEFSLERGTNHLFGAGLLEMLAREMSFDLQALRDGALAAAREVDEPITVMLGSKGVDFGMLTAFPDGIVDFADVKGVDMDLVVRPFLQKGAMTSLRQFSVNAMNHHHGMQAVERFGARWTGETDFDEDGYENEMTTADISALVAWQATLPAPTIRNDVSADWQDAATRGLDHMDGFGCTTCHKPSLPLNSLIFADPGPFDMAGTLDTASVQEAAAYNLELYAWAKDLPRDDQGRVLVPLFGDLKRHNMTDNEVDALGNELMGQRFVDRTIFMTAELWGVGSTAPYGHRNDMSSLDQIIRAHGGDARASRDAYVDADDATRSDIIAFLKTLEIAN